MTYEERLEQVLSMLKDLSYTAVNPRHIDWPFYLGEYKIETKHIPAIIHRFLDTFQSPGKLPIYVWKVMRPDTTMAAALIKDLNLDNYTLFPENPVPTEKVKRSVQKRFSIPRTDQEAHYMEVLKQIYAVTKDGTTTSPSSFMQMHVGSAFIKYLTDNKYIVKKLKEGETIWQWRGKKPNADLAKILRHAVTYRGKYGTFPESTVFMMDAPVGIIPVVPAATRDELPPTKRHIRKKEVAKPKITRFQKFISKLINLPIQ